MCDRPLILGSNLPSRGVGSNQEGGRGWTEALVDYLSMRMIFWSRRRCLRRLRGCLDRRVTNPIASKRIYALRGLGNPSGEKGLSSSDRDGLSSPGGRPGNPEPARDGFVVSMASCLPAGFSLLLVLVLAVQTMAWVPFSVLQQWRKKKIQVQGNGLKQETMQRGIVGVLRRKYFLCGSRREFSPSWEKIRVVLMTIAHGAMSSLTLYEFECSKKCSESWGGLSRLHTTEHE